jgi:dipeptide/tripeptide permease
MFKPNISPTLLDQMPLTVPVTKTLKSGEKVILDPDATTERVMLWFYLLINIGAFMGVATTYVERYIGWWLGFFIPLVLYLPLLPMLWYLKGRLVLPPPGGSDLFNVCRIVSICFKRGGFMKIFKGGFFEAAKPSVIALSGNPIQVPWNDEFVEDARRAFQATGIFCFFPVQYINDNGLGEAANAQSTMLRAKGVPNDVIGNFNSLIIILFNPILNYGLYPLLRKRKIHYGPIARITTGLLMSTIGGAGYTLLNYYAYKEGPCGKYGTSEPCQDKGLVADISIWWMAIPYAIGGLSELFVNVPAYGLAYSRSPKNMRGLVSALNLFSTAISYAIGLACSKVIADPYLTWYVFTINRVALNDSNHSLGYLAVQQSLEFSQPWPSGLFTRTLIRKSTSSARTKIITRNSRKSITLTTTRTLRRRNKEFPNRDRAFVSFCFRSYTIV